MIITALFQRLLIKQVKRIVEVLVKVKVLVIAKAVVIATLSPLQGRRELTYRRLLVKKNLGS